VAIDEEQEISTAVQQVNILLVDDKPERLLSYEAALNVLGHNLVRARSGREALAWLMKMEFAAILLDVSMPEMDGFETAALIRGHPRFEETPIVFVTGIHITDMDRRKGYEMGAVDYVQIPVIPDILRGKVRALVQLYLQRWELSRLNRELAATNAALAKAHEELKTENTRELQILNRNLERTNSELIATNAKLLREIAEREKAERELSRAARRKDEYIAILAHELRNPLSAVHNAVQVLQLDTMSDSQLSWARSLLQRQVKHLTCLMDDLLDISRISNGRIQLRLETVDLTTIIKQAVETVAPTMEEHHHRIELAVKDGDYWVSGDTVRLTQILGNLLTNAAKYMEDGGVVRLSLEPDGKDSAVIRVRDQGVGIPEELLDSVFDLFVQAPTGLNRAQGGLGIGLALVRALVTLHGGSTGVKSDGPGRGAEFSVRLPLTSAPERTAQQAPVPAGQAAGRRFRVAIIDDNRDSADGLAICLESQGFTVDVSDTGAAGIASVKANAPDVVLLDIGLPDMDGYQVAAKLRADPALATLRIVAMSGYGGKADQSRARDAGIDHYLVKPVDYSQLVAALSAKTGAATA
jgi:signal transduction histidine kinase